MRLYGTWSFLLFVLVGLGCLIGLSIASIVCFFSVRYVFDGSRRIFSRIHRKKTDKDGSFFQSLSAIVGGWGSRGYLPQFMQNVQRIIATRP